MNIAIKKDTMWVEVSEMNSHDYTELLEYVRINMLTPIYCSHGYTRRPGAEEHKGHYTGCFFRETADKVLMFLEERKARSTVAV